MKAEAEVIETIVPCKAEAHGSRDDGALPACPRAGARLSWYRSAPRPVPPRSCFFSCTLRGRRAANIEKEGRALAARIAEEAAKQSGRGIIPQVRYTADYVAALNDALFRSAAVHV